MNFKKIGIVVGFCLLLSSNIVEVSSATPYVTLTKNYAFFEFDNRPYLAELSMKSTYVFRNQVDDPMTKESFVHTDNGVYLTDRIDSTYSTDTSIFASNYCYVDRDYAHAVGTIKYY